MLWHPGGHERLVERPWRDGAARDAIEAIVVEAEDAFEPATLAWPLHELDDDGAPPPATTVYMGSAGVLWALDRLGSERDWAAVARELPERYRSAPDLGRSHPSLLLGESGVPLVEELVAGSTDRDRLAGLVAANADAEERELMWGSPGTMLAAEVLAGRTGEGRWLELWERSADRLLETWRDDGLWLQRLDGRDGHMLGPVHGYAGNVFALARRRDGLAQWPPALEPSGDPSSPTRTQFCHGAPGIVATLAHLAPDDAEWTALLVAGAS